MPRSSGSSGVNDRAFAGDWNNLGFDQAGTTRNNGGSLQWLLDIDRDTDSEYIFRFGLAGDRGVVGNFNGTGADDIAATRPSGGQLQWYMHYANAAPSSYPSNDSTVGVNAQFNFGLPGDIPLAGDFNNDGITDIAAVRASGGFLTWYVHFGTGGTPYPQQRVDDVVARCDLRIWT